MEGYKQQETELLKIVVLGGTKVGKTSFIKAAGMEYKKDDFSENERATIGADFYPCIIEKQGISINQQIWDAGGNRNFCPLITITTICKKANVFILVLDGTKLISENIDDMFSEAVNISPDAKFYVVINKADHADFKSNEYQASNKQYIWDAITSHTSIKEKHLAKDAVFICSAKDKTNLLEVFERIRDDFINGLKAIKPEPSQHSDSQTTTLPDLEDNTWPISFKVWLGVNGVIAAASLIFFILAAFAVGSFLTFSILPSAFIGAAIITVVALAVWNIGYGIFKSLSHPPSSSSGSLPNFEIADDEPTSTSNSPKDESVLSKLQNFLRNFPGQNVSPVYPSPLGGGGAGANSKKGDSTLTADDPPQGNKNNLRKDL